MSDQAHFHVTSYIEGTTSANDEKKSLWAVQIFSSFHYAAVWCGKHLLPSSDLTVLRMNNVKH